MSASLVTREPVAIRTAAVALLTVLVHLGVVRGWLPIEADSEAFVAALVDVIGFAVAAVWSRQAVTPVAAPDTQALLREALNNVASVFDNDAGFQETDVEHFAYVDEAQDWPAARPEHDLSPGDPIREGDITGSYRL